MPIWTEGSFQSRSNNKRGNQENSVESMRPCLNTLGESQVYRASEFVDIAKCQNGGAGPGDQAASEATKERVVNKMPSLLHTNREMRQGTFDMKSRILLLPLGYELVRKQRRGRRSDKAMVGYILMKCLVDEHRQCYPIITIWSHIVIILKNALQKRRAKYLSYQWPNGTLLAYRQYPRGFIFHRWLLKVPS